MGHWCRICGRERPNEKFSGKGRREHVCKECVRRPKEELEDIDQTQEIWGYMKQSHISKKNMVRLKKLADFSNVKISKMAKAVLEVGELSPYKKRRLKFLAKEHRDLIRKLRETGLIHAHHH